MIIQKLSNNVAYPLGAVFNSGSQIKILPNTRYTSLKVIYDYYTDDLLDLRIGTSGKI